MTKEPMATTTEPAWSPRLTTHLQRARERAGLRRVDLANRLGVSEETVRLWERGAARPTPDRLERLIAVLSIGVPSWEPDTDRDAGDEVQESEFARRLRSERSARGITQASAAVELGVAQATYAGWELGRALPAHQHVAVVASFLGLSPSAVQALVRVPLVIDIEAWPPFGQLVGSRRQTLQLTRVELAETLGVAPRAIMSWELGYRRPPRQKLSQLALVLGVEVSELAVRLPQRPSLSRLGELIVERQQALGLQSADLARLIGTTEPTISRWINGRSRPVPGNLARLAEVLKVPLKHVAEAAL